jgi:hypothetical protein
MTVTIQTAQLARIKLASGLDSGATNSPSKRDSKLSEKFSQPMMSPRLMEMENIAKNQPTIKSRTRRSPAALLPNHDLSRITDNEASEKDGTGLSIPIGDQITIKDDKEDEPKTALINCRDMTPEKLHKEDDDKTELELYMSDQ